MTTLTLEHVKNTLSDLGVARAVREERLGDHLETRTYFLDAQDRPLDPESRAMQAIRGLEYDAQLIALFSELDDDKSDEIKYAVTSLDTQTGEITQSYASLDMVFSLGAPIDIAKNLNELKKQGIDRFTIAYKGAYDDGRFIGSAALDNEGRSIPSFSAHESHDMALDLAYEMLYQMEPDWDIGQGSEGVIQIEISSGEVRLDHADLAMQEDKHHAGYVSLVQLIAPEKEREREKLNTSALRPTF